MDIPSIMSIRELIDAAFGDSNKNVVNHKLIQTVLIILARQLRLLERRVGVELGRGTLEESSGTSISVTEVKLHANVPRKKKGRSPDTAGSSTMGLKGSSEATKPSSAKVISKASAGSYDKTSSSGTKSTTQSSDKTATAKSSSGVTSSTTKSTAGKSSSDKTSSGKMTSEETTTDKTSTKSTDQTKSSSKSSSDKKTTSDETTKSSSGKTSSGTKSSTDKAITDKSSIAGGKAPSTKKGKILPEDYQDIQDLLETIEEQRERELRVIHQRADSREEREKTPTPIASMESMEKQYEKLLVVERVPTDVKARESRSKSGARGKTPVLSVVTQDEFSQLATVVRELQDKFKTVGVAELPENAQLMKDLRKKASLTDAMAALQLSARMEAAEKALERLMALITEIINSIYVENKKPAFDTKDFVKRILDSKEDLSELIFEVTTVVSQVVAAKRKSMLADAPSEVAASRRSLAPKPRKSLLPKSESKESVALSTITRMTEKQVGETTEKTTRKTTEKPTEKTSEIMQFEIQMAQELEEPTEKIEKPDAVSYEELDNALQELYDECFKIVTNATNRSNANANNALKIATQLEGKLDESLNLGDRMFDLENMFSEYAEQINTLDTGLSSQMTNYQEQLTQMQHDLESGLETMAEALANVGGDTAAVGELNNNFTNLQTDIEIATARQIELRKMQDTLSLDLQALWKQIEILRDTKSDRDEVADALRDKAGLADLNGMVSRQEFDAVRGDFEKRIGQAYDKFNNQEIIWQKAIDDLIRELNEKADWIQVISLQGSINQYLDKLRAKIRAMEEIVGEPRASAITRKLHRDADCLSCATPAHMDLEESKTAPSLPAFPSSRPPAVGAEAKSSRPKGDGDHADVCYPGMPVPHAVDPRAHFCHRYCGGSHTMLNNLTRAPVGMIITQATREVNTAVGSDGKLYMVDEIKKPCIPCNYKRTTSAEPLEAEPAPNPNQGDFVSDTMTLDFRPSTMVAAGASDVVSVTPPPPIEDD